MADELPPHAPIATGATVYGDGSLDWHRRTGVTHLRAWCVHPGCTHWTWLHLDTLISSVGPGVSLVQLARRTRCKSCGRKGAHIEPSPWPGRGMPDYPAWVRAERDRCRAFLAATDSDVSTGGTVQDGP
ncbi:hypothetical protein ABMY26_06320 (plasmid) [Azospirillum sp. HJ39]|uniref:hypothetical protein n=1 Tax=Azospirillum sp. HJ39 TaxID=3159496 RepID=UPI0035585C0C